jgi:hypothetical protein
LSALIKTSKPGQSTKYTQEKTDKNASHAWVMMMKSFVFSAAVSGSFWRRQYHFVLFFMA